MLNPAIGKLINNSENRYKLVKKIAKEARNISAEAEKQITFQNNKYTPNKTLLIFFGDKKYTKLAEFQAQTSHDAGSMYL